MRVLKNQNREHPAIAQFKLVRAKEIARKRLQINPDLPITAFSHWPGREGDILSATEVYRIKQGLSIQISGVILTIEDLLPRVVCKSCYERIRDSGLKHSVRSVYFERDNCPHLCSECGETFMGER